MVFQPEQPDNRIRPGASTLPVLMITAGLVVLPLLMAACATAAPADDTDNIDVSDKISVALLSQVTLRREQISQPALERLELMKNMGMKVDNLEIHMIFIHLEQTLSTAQVEELEALGITLYLDSWIPPVGAHPTGFLIADMPVTQLETLAGKDYIIQLDTAEQKMEPQGGNQPQVE